MRADSFSKPKMWASLLCGLLVISAVIHAGAKPKPSYVKVSGVVVGPENIGGVVTSRHGAEAGVWVIAETKDFQTKLRKIVVTDDQGRFLLPDLPKASYKVWVRGYGLVDSTPVDAVPGKTLALHAVIAPNPVAAAQYYPPNYWLSLLKIPPKSAFPMPAPGADSVLYGVHGAIPTQAHWVDLVKSGCQACHQMGTKIIREMPRNLGTFPSATAAWDRRIRSGQTGGEMVDTMSQFGYNQGIAMFAGLDFAHHRGRGSARAAAAARLGTQCGAYAVGSGRAGVVLSWPGHYL